MRYSELASRYTLSQRIRLFSTYYSKKERRRVQYDLWPLQARMLDAMERDQKLGAWQAFCPKARQNGISEMAGSRAIDSAYTYSNFEMVVLSKRSDDAEYLLAKRILDKLLHDQENIPKLCAQMRIPTIEFPRLVWPTEPKESVSKIVLSNGSSFKALSATNNSGAGMTADGVLLDEAGGFDEVGDLRTLVANIEPVIEKSVAAGIGWMEVVGTSEPGSSFNDIIDQLRKKPADFPTRRLHFLPWQVDPGRTRAWYEMQLRKDPVMTKLQYPDSLDDFFTVKTGLIYPHFDDEKHIGEFEPLASDQLYVLFDHGYKHNSAIVFMYYDRNYRRIKIRHVITYMETEVATIAVHLKSMLRKIGRRPKKMIADTSIFKETGVISVDKVFRKHGISWSPAFKSDETAGIDLVNGLLTRNRIILHPECLPMIEEFHRWKWHKNGRYPEDCNNDTLDALRYGVTEVFGQGGAGSETYVPKDPYSHVGKIPGFTERRGSGVLVPDSDESDFFSANISF